MYAVEERRTIFLGFVPRGDGHQDVLYGLLERHCSGYRRGGDDRQRRAWRKTKLRRWLLGVGERGWRIRRRVFQGQISEIVLERLIFAPLPFGGRGRWSDIWGIVAARREFALRGGLGEPWMVDLGRRPTGRHGGTTRESAMVG